MLLLPLKKTGTTAAPVMRASRETVSFHSGSATSPDCNFQCETSPAGKMTTIPPAFSHWIDFRSARLFIADDPGPWNGSTEIHWPSASGRPARR